MDNDNLFRRQSFDDQRSPFEVRTDDPNTVTLAAMDASEKGEDLHGPYDSIADLMKALDA